MNVISRVIEEKDLDVWCTTKMKLPLQVQKVVAEALQTLSMMKRSFKYLYKRTCFYSCTKPTSDHILNTVHQLGHHIWQKTLML